MKSFDKCRIESSLSKLLFSIILQEQSKLSISVQEEQCGLLRYTCTATPLELNSPDI